jgi:hypothetical protein
MSQESKIDDLRIRLAKALTWLDVPGVSNEQLNKLQLNARKIRSCYAGSEASLIFAIQTASYALSYIQLEPENDYVQEHIRNLQFGVSSIENSLKVISPNRIDVISSDLR